MGNINKPLHKCRWFTARFDWIHSVLFTWPLSLSLSLPLIPPLSNHEPPIFSSFFFFFHWRRLFFLARSFIHPNVAKLYTVKLETANGARFPLHAVAILSPLLPSHTTLHFPLRVAAFYFHFHRGNGKVCYDRKVGWEWFLNRSTPVYFIPCQFVSNRTITNTARIDRFVHSIHR